jgi:LCP family protein required for cell wall assembly
MFTARVLAGKAVYALSCLTAAVLLVASGYAHKAVGQITGLEQGIAINGSSIGASAGSSVGAMNILLMGLESRTDFKGQILSSQELTETHSGKESSVAAGLLGSQDTDTLILIHIFAGGQRAVGFSIPRDTVVTYPSATYEGITEGKIDQAYAWAYDVSEQQTSTTSMTSQQRALAANRAGQGFEIQTVEALTGVTIDHFVESNLIGFFSLAQAFGGIEVCVKPAPAQGGFAAGANLTDYDPQTNTDNSGFNAYHDGYSKAKGGAQYLHLSPAQSLAFVRSRDTLPGVDIGRTHRQQETIDYVVYQLKHGNYFSDLSKLNSILEGASNYLMVDQHFNLIDFATNMRALTSENLKLQTLPGTPQNGVVLPGFPQGEDVINVDKPAIQRLVRNAFYPQPAARKSPSAAGSARQATPIPAASTVTVDVYNGGTMSGLATKVSQALAARGYTAGIVGNAPAQSRAAEAGTQVFSGAGASANAAKIATEFGTTATALTSLPAGHVEVLLGSSSTAVPPGLAASGAVPAGTAPAGTAVELEPSSTSTCPAGTATAGTATAGSATPAATSTAGAGNGTGGGSVTVTANDPYGIPCVY